MGLEGFMQSVLVVCRQNKWRQDGECRRFAGRRCPCFTPVGRRHGDLGSPYSESPASLFHLSIKCCKPLKPILALLTSHAILDR